MSNRCCWISDLLSRRILARPAKSNRRRSAANRRGLRLFESLEPRMLLTSLAWYRLDEVAGTVATDASGNNNDGTVTGGAWAGGQVDGAIEFNADGNISVPASAFAAVDQQVTFAFWAYGGDTQPADDSILYGVNADGDRVFNVHLSFSNGRVYWDAGEGGGYDRINKVADPLVHKDSWHHWAFTKNAGTGIMNIYLDGEVWASGTGKTKSMAGVTSFTLGAHTSGSSSYDGLLDDVRLFDTELTAAEVQDLFTVTSNGELLAIDGVPSIGQTLTSSHSLIGLGTISHQWQRNGADIPGATNSSYTLSAADDNALIAVVASYDGGGNRHSVTSASVGPVNNFTANSLAELRAAGLVASNSTITLSPTGGDPHPVTGIVTAGEYWINGDHIANPTQSEPTFLELGSTNNTYNLTGTRINLDTRKLDGFGRALGHDSGIEVVKVSGSGNTVNGLNLTGHDLALDTDPDAQRYADWAGVYVQMVGSNNTIDDVHVLTRGSSPYGYGDVFGKGARRDPQGWAPGPALDENGDPVGDGVGLPWYGHNKTSAFQVIDTVDAVINDMHLDVRTYGHGFFVQGTADNTTLTNSTVTGQLFSSNDVIATDLYQQYGFTSHGNELPPDIMISGNEDGVRMYTGPTGLTVENVVVTNMRTGFSVALGRGTMNLNNVEAYGTENGFNFKSNTTITNAKGDVTHGPLLHTPYDSSNNTSVDVELVGGIPEGGDWAVAYVAGNNLDITISSDLPAGALPDNSLIRFGQVYFDNWRDAKHPTGPEDHGDNLYDYINSTFHNNTNQMVVLGNEAIGNDGSSLGYVITNGKQNAYDGISLIPTGTRTLVEHIAGLGNNGTAADGSLDTNASIVADGGTLEIQPGIRITGEKLTITGDGVDGKGALYSDGSPDSNTRFGSSNGSDETTVVLDGDASIGVGVAGNQLLLGRIQGTGNLTKRGPGILTAGKSSTFDGNLIVAEGHITGRPGVVHRDLTVAAGASISGIGNNTFDTQGDVFVDGQLDLNSRTDNNTLSGRVGGLLGSGQVVSTNPFAGAGASLEIRPGSSDAVFTGQVATAVSITKSNAGTQILSGNNTYTGTTTVDDGLLQIDGTHTGGGDYTIHANGILGGNGDIDSAVVVNAGGHLSPGASAGTLSVNDVTFSSGSFFAVELGGTVAGTQHDQLITDSAVIGGLLTISLVESDGATYRPSPTDTFTVLVGNTSLSGMFENVASGQRLATVDGGGTFVVTYGGPSNVVLLSDFSEGELVATAFDAVSDHVLNGQTDVTFTVANAGLASAGTFETHIVWSANDSLGDADDVIVPGSVSNFTGLAAGANETKTISLQLNQSVLYANALAADGAGQSVGTVSTDNSRLFLVIDVNNDVIESNEANNSAEGHTIDSDDITYFPWDKNSNGSVEPLEAITSIQAIGTNDAASDFDGNGIVSPLEALSAVQRIGYSRADVLAKLVDAKATTRSFGSTAAKRATPRSDSTTGQLQSSTQVSATEPLPSFVNAAASEDESLFPQVSDELERMINLTDRDTVAPTTPELFAKTAWLDVI